MKKIILFALLFLGLQGFAQKRVYIYNFSIKSVKINYISTITNPGGAFPNIMTSYTTPFTIASGGTYTMVTTTAPIINKFPYDSPTSIPFITKWKRRLTQASPSGPDLTMLQLNAYANGYKFDHVGLVFPSGITYKVGNVTYNGPGSTNCVELVNEFGNAMIAEYSSNLISATETEYIIIITDM